MTESAAPTVSLEHGINELGIDQIPEIASPHTVESKSKNQKRPRLRLRSLDDTLRAHARLLRASFGKVEADVYSRMLKRHADMLSERYIQSLDQQLRERNQLLAQARRVIDAEPVTHQEQP
jgi:hypothetical protein